MDAFIDAFIPLFVAIDVLGILPLFIGLTEGISLKQRRVLTLEATLTAFIIALVILFAGNVIFKNLGITVDDLRVGGGIVLLVLSIRDLLFDDMGRRNPVVTGGIGIVPIGIPLIMGPAAITTVIVSQQQFGYWIASLALISNLLIVLMVFYFGPKILGMMGTGVTKAIAKIASLFMAAIAVALIRGGITGMLGV